MAICRDNWWRVFKILKFELKTSKNESRKFTIFQTNQYEKQNSNLSNVFNLVTWINETWIIFNHIIIHKGRKSIQLLSSTSLKVNGQCAHTSN